MTFYGSIERMVHLCPDLILQNDTEAEEFRAIFPRNPAVVAELTA